MSTRCITPVPPSPPLADRLDAVLPQMQCRRCGYDGCRPYAEAIAAGDAVNRCPPGGQTVIAALAELTGTVATPLDTAHGRHGPLTVAAIDEARCIGCTLCIDACPVDAIVGAAKRMHTVVATLCTGCDLCIAPCPVDCIQMIPARREWTADDAHAARLRFDARARRRAAKRLAHGPAADANGIDDTTAPDPAAVAAVATDDADRTHRSDAVAAALARARARRAGADGRGAR